MFFKLQKCFTIFKKLFLTETEMQILTEIQIPRDLTWRRISFHHRPPPNFCKAHNNVTLLSCLRLLKWYFSINSLTMRHQNRKGKTNQIGALSQMYHFSLSPLVPGSPKMEIRFCTKPRFMGAFLSCANSSNGERYWTRKTRPEKRR